MPLHWWINLTFPIIVWVSIYWATKDSGLQGQPKWIKGQYSNQKVVSTQGMKVKCPFLEMSCHTQDIIEQKDLWPQTWPAVQAETMSPENLQIMNQLYLAECNPIKSQRWAILKIASFWVCSHCVFLGFHLGLFLHSQILSSYYSGSVTKQFSLLLSFSKQQLLRELTLL